MPFDARLNRDEALLHREGLRLARKHRVARRVGLHGFRPGGHRGRDLALRQALVALRLRRVVGEVRRARCVPVGIRPCPRRRVRVAHGVEQRRVVVVGVGMELLAWLCGALLRPAAHAAQAVREVRVPPSLEERLAGGGASFRRARDPHFPEVRDERAAVPPSPRERLGHELVEVPSPPKAAHPALVRVAHLLDGGVVLRARVRPHRAVGERDDGQLDGATARGGEHRLAARVDLVGRGEPQAEARERFLAAGVRRAGVEPRLPVAERLKRLPVVADLRPPGGPGAHDVVGLGRVVGVVPARARTRIRAAGLRA